MDTGAPCCRAGRRAGPAPVSNTTDGRSVPSGSTRSRPGPGWVPDVMRIVITGATGNIGTALLRALHGGPHEVVGVARRPPAGPEAPYDAATWHALDLTREDHTDRLRAAVRGADAVVHLAWGFQPSHRLDYLEELGVGGTRRVADAVAAEG